MTDKEFRRLTRSELIDIIYEYQKQEKLLKDEIDELKEQLENVQLKTENAGSIAEAFAGLSGIFEQAQATADQYVTYMRNVSYRTDEDCAAKILSAQEEAERIIEAAKEEAKRYGESS